MTTKSNSAQGGEGKLRGGVTQARVDAWRREHGEVFEMSAAIDDKVDEKGNPVNTVTGWFRKPDLTTISQVEASKHDKGNATRILVQNCFLGGDQQDIFSSEEVLVALFIELNKLFKLRAVEVKKH